MHGYRYPAARARSRAAGARDRLHAGLGVSRGQPADEAGRPRRHDGGRRLPVADPAPLRAIRWRGELRAACGCCSCSRTAAWPRRSASRARTRSCRDRPAASSAWCAPRPRRGFDKVIGFDMGGTSTDVSHYAGELRAHVRDRGRRRADARADDGDPHGRRGRRLDLPLRRRAAARRPGVRRRQPGPACYRRGGPLTVTDCNVMLGKLQPEFFPRVFGPTRRPAARSRRRSQRRFAALADEVGARDRRARRSPQELAEGFLRDRRGEHGECDQADLDRSAATTSRRTRSAASAAPAGSTPAWWPTRSA